MRAWFVAAGLVLVGCKKEPVAVAPKVEVPPPAPAEAKADPARDAAFWAWVSAHLDALKRATSDSPIIEQLDAELAKVDEGLTFELGIGKKPFELVLSADGDTAHFPAVRRLVAAAPALADTKVLAFRPRKPLDGLAIEVEGLQVDPAQIRFAGRPDPDRPGLYALDLYVPGVAEGQEEVAQRAAVLLVDAALGEFDLETRVGNVSVQHEPLEGDSAPFAGLPAWLDAQPK